MSCLRIPSPRRGFERWEYGIGATPLPNLHQCSPALRFILRFSTASPAYTLKEVMYVPGQDTVPDSPPPSQGLQTTVLRRIQAAWRFAVIPAIQRPDIEGGRSLSRSSPISGTARYRPVKGKSKVWKIRIRSDTFSNEDSDPPSTRVTSRLFDLRKLACNSPSGG